ncbi:hypothetical protein HGM15179_016644, partial [Zosterops borbonicus]
GVQQQSQELGSLQTVTEPLAEEQVCINPHYGALFALVLLLTDPIQKATLDRQCLQTGDMKMPLP